MLLAIAKIGFNCLGKLLFSCWKHLMVVVDLFVAFGINGFGGRLFEHL